MYELHHVEEAAKGGAVYDVDNLRVVENKFALFFKCRSSMYKEVGKTNLFAFWNPMPGARTLRNMRS